MQIHQYHSFAPYNALSILEKLSTFPTVEAELNAWWVDSLGKPPLMLRRMEESGHESSGEPSDDDEVDDWRKFFDENADTQASKAGDDKTKGVRLHKMNVHQSLHSLTSHRAVFTHAWMAVLPRLAGDRSASLRVLTIMHHGILPYLTRPVLIMDWISAAVDLGESACIV